MREANLFFRNDDVRDTLDDSLIKITNICIKKNIPISHTVEPANVSKEVVDWLLKMKKEYPNLIEIVQHGFSHQLNYQKKIGGKLKKGEFGGDRSYEEQYAEINEGKELMDKNFGTLWFPLFTFPYGARNTATLKAIKDIGFLVVNGSMSVIMKHKLVYLIGRILHREMLFGRKISWNLKYKPGTNLFQIDTSFSVIKKYLDENNKAIFYTLNELKKITKKYLKKESIIGIVLHHRYHDSPEKIMLLEDYLSWLKNIPDTRFVTQEEIYNKYVK